MAKTKIADIIVPEVFTKYIMQKTIERSALINSGIAQSDMELKIPLGGTVINIPFWKNLNTEDVDEILSDSNNIPVSKMTADKSVACIHLRARGWSANDLASLLAGSNAMNAIALKIADYWAYRLQRTLIDTLDGVFSTSDMNKSVFDISTKAGSDGIISSETMIEGSYLLGDASQKMTGIAMHSNVQKKLALLKLTERIKTSENSPFIDSYLGKHIIVDDSLAPTDVSVGGQTEKAYPLYFFGENSVAYNEGTEIQQLELDRDSLAGDDYIITRRQFTMHPRGMRWKGTSAGATPTNAELKTSTNWELVDDRKNVAIAKCIVRV